MSSYGLQDAGFVDKPLETIISELEAEQLSTIDPGLDVSVSSPAGQMNGIFGAAIRELWEVLQALWASWNPDTSSNTAQSAVSAWTGTQREAASKSTVTGSAELSAGATLDAGAVASVAGDPTARFVTTVAATNAGGGAASFDVPMEAETAGPVVANTGTLTVIDTPSSGWLGITNAADADLGAVQETDTALRLRRHNELQAGGTGTVDALRVDLLQVDDVVAVTVYENTTIEEDADGVPGKAFEAVVEGGTDQDIFDQIWASKPAGIEPFGSTSGTALDSEGNSQSVSFSRPTTVELYLDIEVTTNDNPDLGPVFPADGTDQVEAAAAAWGQANLGVGDDFVYRALISAIFGVSGVTDVPTVEAGTAPAPTVEQNITITSRQLANIDTANVTVTET